MKQKNKEHKINDLEQFRAVVLQLCKCMDLVLKQVFDQGVCNHAIAESVEYADRRERAWREYLNKSQVNGNEAFNVAGELRKMNDWNEGSK